MKKLPKLSQHPPNLKARKLIQKSARKLIQKSARKFIQKSALIRRFSLMNHKTIPIFETDIY